MRETKAQRDAKRRALRQKIIDIVTEHQPLTCYQIAQHLGTEVSFISSACHGLYRNQFLKKGEFVDPDYASGRKARVKVCTWLIGDCADPLPKHALFSDARSTIRTRAKAAGQPLRNGEANNPLAITDEDIEWMNYWRARHKQRCGQSRKIVNDSLTY